ncbi:MAG TPA: hypothetical protein VGR47_20255 [Terracidiphilus sp.]|nr:hypothetical protein [Terracidiphilus sp.]
MKGSIDATNALIVLNLGNRETYSIRSKDICRFGCAALFDEGSAEYRAAKQAVEPTNRIIQLLKMVIDDPTKERETNADYSEG